MKHDAKVLMTIIAIVKAFFVFIGKTG